VKKALIALAAVAILLTAVPAALAGRAHWPAHPFTVTGRVVATDLTAKTVTIKVWRGAPGLGRYHGKQMVLTIKAKATIVRRAFGKPTALTLADVKVGERARAWGQIDRCNPNAVVYRVGRLVLHSTWPFTCVGNVTAVDAAGGTLALKVTRSAWGVRAFIGKQITVQVDAATVIKRLAKGEWKTIALADLTTEDRAVVSGTVNNADPAAKVFIAKRIAVRHRK